ncbi:glycosyltransferase [Coleofasciculus chthonoplastes]|uniref:glycosyltransferase n=1 Tax=Coleofasciculus chthonoplastes TaxID=64178 RepID=UPI0032F788E5
MMQKLFPKTRLTENVTNDTVCIIHPNKSAYSETFIRAHVEKLPATVKVIHYGSWSFPIYQQEDRPILPSDLGSRLMRVANRRVLQRSPQDFQTKALRNFLLDNRVDVVLAEYGFTGVCIMDACLQANVPFVVHFHGLDAYNQSLLDQYKASYKQMFAVTNAVIAVSHDMEQQLLSLGTPPEKLFYNPYGVDTSLFSMSDPAASAPVFVSVGRFVDKKAPHLTLLAFKQVVQKYSEARLVMLGDGILWEACQQLARGLCITEFVDFLGACPHSQVAATMARARAFVQHSMRTTYGDSEGTPVAVLEAGATGLPVIATRHAGIPDVVIEGETGLLVDEGDVEGMAECMMRLADDPVLAARLGKAARDKIGKEFAMDKSISNLWRILERVITANKS